MQIRYIKKIVYWLVYISVVFQSTLLISSNAYASNVWANLQSNLSGITKFTMALFYIVGFALSMSAIYRLKKFGHRTAFMHVEAGIIGPACQFFIGVALMFTPRLIKIINYSIWENPDFESINSYPQNTSFSVLDTIKPMVQVIQVIGMFAFLRGFILLSRSAQHGSQPGMASKGVVHIVGGILAMNIVATVNIVVNSLGTGA